MEQASAMRGREWRPIFSPTDLLVLSDSQFAAWMDRRFIDDPRTLQPDPTDSFREIVSSLGRERELQHVERLRAGGMDVRSPTSERKQAGPSAPKSARRTWIR